MQWMRFTFAPADSLWLVRAGTAVPEAELTLLLTDAPWWIGWWDAPEPAPGSAFRVADGALRGILVMDWPRQEAHFRGCWPRRSSWL